MTYTASLSGREISCVFHGVPKRILNNPDKLRADLLKALEIEKFTILAISDHKFSPQGYTCMIMLSESHLAIHTYPEHNSIAYQIYSCRSPTDGIETTAYLIKEWKPKKVDRVERIVPVVPNFKIPKALMK